MAVHKPVLTTYIPQDPFTSSSSSGPISIPGQPSDQPASPVLKIDDCTNDVFANDSNGWDTKDDSFFVNQLSRSPKRVGQHCYYGNVNGRSNSLSVSPPCVSPSVSEEDLRMHNCPSSPLLVAMRDAVDSLNKYEDFKIIEKIGAGFFADVYKVIHLCKCFSELATRSGCMGGLFGSLTLRLVMTFVLLRGSSKSKLSVYDTLANGSIA